MPLFWFCLSAFIGIFTASFCQLPLFFWVSATLVCLAAGIFEFFHFRYRNHPLLSRPIFCIPLALILCAFFLGGTQFQGALPAFSPDNLLWYVSNTPVSLTGVIKSDPYRANNITSAVIKIESIAIEGNEVKVKGDLSLLLPAGCDIRYGDRLTLTGPLKQTFHADSLPITSRLAQKKLFVGIVMPSFFDVDKYVAIWRSRVLIHVYTGKNFQRGHFSFYNMERKKDLYVNGKRFYNYYKPSPNFRGRFTNAYVVNEKEYREMKRESLLRQQTEEDKKILQQEIETIMFGRLVDDDSLTHKQRAKILGISEATFYYKLQKYNDEIE